MATTPSQKRSNQKSAEISPELISERIVLGAILEQPGLLKDAALITVPDDFSLENHRRLMQLYIDFDANQRPITEQSVKIELERRQQLEDLPGGSSYLTDLLCDAVSELKHVRFHAEKLKEYGLARNARILLATTEVRINDPANRIQDVLDGLVHKANLLRSGADLQGNLRPEAALWPDPQPLGAALPPVMECDLDNMLPEVFRDVVTDVSHRLQTPPDYAVASGICTLAGAVNRRAVIVVKRRDETWVSVANLWGAIVGDSGTRKSPVMSTFLKLLQEVESDWYDTYESKIKQYTHAQKLFELDEKVWEELYKRSRKPVKAGKEPPIVPPRPEELPPAPICPRLITHNVTVEALHMLLSQNPAGLYIPRDELSGWFAELDKFGREGDRQFHMMCWNGNQSVSYDRIARGHVRAKHCCTSMLGSLQPGRLRGYMNDVLQDGPTNDGLIARFQVLVCPDMLEHYEHVDEPANQEAFDKLGAVYRVLTELDPEAPFVFHFADDAQEFFAHWDAAMQSEARNRELHPALRSHLSKYDSLMVKLALLFALADGAWDGIVHLKHAQRAVNFCTYLESHARRVYSMIISPERAAAESLLKRLIVDGWKRSEGTFTLRSVYENDWKGLHTADEARAACDVLIDAGYLRRIDMGKSPGRPTEAFAINPKLSRIR